MSNCKQVYFTSKEKAELLDDNNSSEYDHIADDEIAGHNLVSLISSGTEINWQYLGDEFPIGPGYTSVFKVEKIGNEVENIKEGDLVYYDGKHKSYQKCKANLAYLLPDGLALLPPLKN